MPSYRVLRLGVKGGRTLGAVKTGKMSDCALHSSSAAGLRSCRTTLFSDTARAAPADSALDNRFFCSADVTDATHDPGLQPRGRSVANSIGNRLVGVKAVNLIYRFRRDSRTMNRGAIRIVCLGRHDHGGKDV